MSLTGSRENGVPAAHGCCAAMPAEPVAEAAAACRPSSASRHSQHAVAGRHGHAATVPVETR